MKRWIISFVAAAVAIAVLIILAAIFGHPPRVLLRALIEGSLGSPFALRATILKATPLLLTGISVVIAFRSGIWNIGGEGQFIVGALAAFMASRWGPVPALLAGVVAGSAWASIAAALRLWRNAPEVLTTILLNFISVQLLGWCVSGPLQESSRQYPQTDSVPITLPTIDGGIHAGVIIAIVVSFAVWWLMFRTTEGLRLRATGLNESAAQFAGVNTPAQLARAMAMSGGVAGLAGAIELLGVTHRLFERFAAGYGYSGIAVALLAQLGPLAAIPSALFFGALVSGAGEAQRSANISSTAAVLGQAVVILALLLGQRREIRQSS